MKPFSLQESVFLESETKCRKRESTKSNTTNDKPRQSYNSTRKSNFIRLHKLAVICVAVLCLTNWEIGRMAVTRNVLSRATTHGMRKQHAYIGPLAVSASTIPSIVSRFHHNQVENQNQFRNRLFSQSNSKTNNFLSEIRKYRGGDQDNFRRRRQQRWNSNIKRNRNDDKRDKPDENPLAPLIQSQNRFTKIVRQSAGGVLTLVGFVGSSLASFATDRRSFEDRFVEPIQALQLYLKTSG